MTDIILALNEKLTQFIKMQPFGLAHGRMGNSIYFYQMSKLLNNLQYENTADSLLDFVYQKVIKAFPMDIENGLAGIGLGLAYLIKKQMAEGNINEVLDKIDVPIYKALFFQKDKNPEDNLLKEELLYYCSVRYGDQKKGSESEFILKELIFKQLNSYIFISDDLFKEPYSFSLHFRLPFFLYTLGVVASQEPFRHKIKKMCDEITNKVISMLPVLQSHRLYMIWGMIRLTKMFQLPEWDAHIRLLKNETDLNHIMHYEIPDMNIFFKDGLSGIGYLLLDYNKMAGNNEKLQFDLPAFCNRIITSPAWRKLLDDESFFKYHSDLYGFCGTVLLLLNMQK